MSRSSEPIQVKIGNLSLRFLFSLLIDVSGLGFRPLPPEDNVESTLIWYRGTNRENYEVWTNALDEFLSRKFDLRCNFFARSRQLHQRR